MVMQHLLGNKNLNDIWFEASDINCDKKIDSMDMYKIMQFLLNKENIQIK